MKIKSIKLENFKRWKSLELSFDKMNEFYAENGGGKTSIFQAYLWVLGLDTDNIFPKIDSEVIEDLETRVEMVVEIDGYEHTYTRTSKPQFIIDELKVKTKKVYVETICSQVGISQKELEMLCNTYLFNQDSSKWGWSERFKMLSDMLSFNMLTSKYADNYKYINKYITSRKTPIEIAKILRDSKKDINNQKTFINGSIETLNKQLNIYNYDYEKLENEKQNYEKAIKENEEKLYQLTHNATFELEMKIDSMKKDISNKTNLRLQKIENNKQALRNFEEQLKAKKDYISQVSNEIDNLSNTIENVENEAICGSCGQKLPIERIEEIKQKLINERNSKLDLLDSTINFTENLEKNIETFDVNIEETQEVIDLRKQVAELEQQLINLDNQNKEDDVFDIETEIDFLKGELEEVNKQLYTKPIKERLEVELSENRQKLLTLSQDFTNNAKAEEELQNYFKLVEVEYDKAVKQAFGEEISFKFFTLKKDGDYNQDCIIRRDIKGILTSYYEMSLGERLKTDLMTSLGFQKLLGVELPIWVDNAQDMTDEVPTCENQIIILNTSKTQNNLKGEYINGK